MLNNHNFFENFKIRSEVTLTESSLPFLIINSCYKFGKVAYFLKNNNQIIEIKNKIGQLDKSIKVLLLSDFDCTFFSNLSPSKDVLLERIQTLFILLNENAEKIVFLSTLKSLIHKIPNIEEMKKKFFFINTKKKKIIMKKF